MLNSDEIPGEDDAIAGATILMIFVDALFFVIQAVCVLIR